MMTSQQAFQLMRVKLLTDANSDQGLMDDAGSYAWSKGVYPLFNNTGIHEAFESEFKVTKEMVEELAAYLDKRWHAKDYPSFYQLEDHFNVNSGARWDRVALLHACRYFFLEERFDDDLWSGVLKKMDHPVEAGGVVRPFEKMYDIGL